MADHIQEWRSPSPLWPAIVGRDGGQGATTMAEPSILGFASDAFMEDFLAVLERDPSQLEGYVAKPETWRKPASVPARTKALLQPKGPLSVVGRRRALARRPASADGDAATPAGADAGTAELPLKLYHPAHQRFYLVTSSLVCRTVGLPDRRVDRGRDERASFVVRRLLPPAGTTPSTPVSTAELQGWDEHAFLVTPDGYAWQKVGSFASEAAARVLPGEERTPLFGAGFTADDGRERRMFAGLVPVGARETYLGAPLRQGTAGGNGSGGNGAAGNGAGGNGAGGNGAGANGAQGTGAAAPPDPRLTVFRIQVLEPWRAVINQALRSLPQANESQEKEGFAGRAQAIDGVREQIQTASWYILLDLAEFLRTELPDVWAQVVDPPATAPAPGTLLHALQLPVPLPTSRAGFFLEVTPAPPTPPIYDNGDIEPTLADALRAVTATDVPEGLEDVTAAYDRQAPDPKWPSFLFPLADPDRADETFIGALRAKLKQLDTLIAAELATSPTDAPQPATTLLTPSAFNVRDGWFVIRNVFERPNCGQLKPPVVSAPTKPFELAPFFDPDAPARPIRIALPADTTPAGLRKYAKSTVFQFSNILCGQVDGLKKITFGDLVRSVLPWPFYKALDLKAVGVCKDGEAPEGLACSLSIPIVTICALILLIMIVTLLDYIFRWIPWFIACFRIPGLSGKNA